MPTLIKPPCGDTGVELTKRSFKPTAHSLGLGWFRFTVPVSCLDHWVSYLAQIFNFNPDNFFPGGGWNGYSNSLRFPGGLLLAYEPPSDDDRPAPNSGKLTVDIPQSFLDMLSGKKIWDLFLESIAYDAKWKRLDFYFDDYRKIIHPNELRRQLYECECVSPRVKMVRRFDEFDLHERRLLLRKGLPLEETSNTLYIGSRKSGKMLRFYVKDALRNRFEIEFKDSYASGVQKFISDRLIDDDFWADFGSGESAFDFWFGAIASKLIKGAFAFYHVPVPSEIPANISRDLELAPWFVEFLGDVEGARIRLQYIPPSLESKVIWIQHQVMKSLAMVRAVRRFWNVPWITWLDEGLIAAESRWNKRDLALMNKALLTSPAGWDYSLNVA